MWDRHFWGSWGRHVVQMSSHGQKIITRSAQNWKTMDFSWVSKFRKLFRHVKGSPVRTAVNQQLKDQNFNLARDRNGWLFSREMKNRILVRFWVSLFWVSAETRWFDTTTRSAVPGSQLDLVDRRGPRSSLFDTTGNFRLSVSLSVCLIMQPRSAITLERSAKFLLSFAGLIYVEFVTGYNWVKTSRTKIPEFNDFFFCWKFWNRLFQGPIFDANSYAHAFP